MNFDNITKNKTTQFICNWGDKSISITYQYDIESFEEVERAFNAILQFLTFSNSLKEMYTPEDTQVEEDNIVL